MAVDRYAGPNSDQKEERRGVIRNILSDMLDVTSKKDRRIEIDSEVMSLAKWGEYVTINGDGKHRRKCRFSKK